MRQVLILYTSSTGNTEEIASQLQQQLTDKGFGVTMQELGMDEITEEDMAAYDVILFGTYTYDEGDLPFETDVFCDSLRIMDLSGKTVGLFGSGDTAYDLFCHAIDIMKEEFEQVNATVLPQTVKIELDPDSEEDVNAIRMLVDQATEAMHRQKLAE